MTAYVVRCQCGYGDDTLRDRRGAEIQAAIHEETNRQRPHAHDAYAVPGCEER